MVLQSGGGGGNRGRGGRERAQSGQSSCALGRQTMEDCEMLSIRPQVGIWLCEATDPAQHGVGQGEGRGNPPPPYQVLNLWHPTLDTAEIRRE
jgi:hypothetical protein